MLVALDLQHMLEELGYRVVGIAPDHRSAQACAQAHPIDLALVDINLRDGATGPDIAAELAEKHGVLIIFVTGNIGMAPRVSGALGAMGKPITPKSLAAAIAYASAVRDGSGAVEAPAELQAF